MVADFRCLYSMSSRSAEGRCKRITLCSVKPQAAEGFAFKERQFGDDVHGALPLVISSTVSQVLSPEKGICSFPCRRSCFLKDAVVITPVVSDESCRMTITILGTLPDRTLAEITADGYYIG